MVGCRSKVDKSKLVSGTRVALDMTTLTIMRFLPREARSQLAASDAVPAACVLSFQSRPAELFAQVTL